jgi:hypothetical protein
MFRFGFPSINWVMQILQSKSIIVWQDQANQHISLMKNPIDRLLIYFKDTTHYNAAQLLLSKFHSIGNHSIKDRADTLYFTFTNNPITCMALLTFFPPPFTKKYSNNVFGFLFSFPLIML